MYRDSIQEILGPKTISAVTQGNRVECYIVHEERRGSLLVELMRGPVLTVQQIEVLRSLILDARSHFFAVKRCLPVANIRFDFLDAAERLELIVGFSCRDWEFRCGDERKGSFFDPVQDRLLILVKNLFPDYASPNRRYLWRQGAISELLTRRENEKSEGDR